MQSSPAALPVTPARGRTWSVPELLASETTTGSQMDTSCRFLRPRSGLLATSSPISGMLRARSARAAGDALEGDPRDPGEVRLVETNLAPLDRRAGAAPVVSNAGWGLGQHGGQEGRIVEPLHRRPGRPIFDSCPPYRARGFDEEEP